MDSKTYVQNAIRTESRIDTAKVNDRFAFQAVVQAFVASSQLLDLYKKHIFYGKPINEEKWLSITNALTEADTELRRGKYLPLTRSFQDVIHVDTRVLHAIIGIATEAGELMEAIQAKLEVQQNLDTVNLAEEVGDLNWYEALLIDALDADWDEVRERNIAKLRARYPDKFDADKAINRDLKKEREILEGGDARMKAEEGYPFGGSDY
jgi:NTP pyrophosphatase (non-canonical NTP hydrolase)